MNRRWFLIAYKVTFAVLVVAAITIQLNHGLQAEAFSTVNFFSFFTIESNLFGAATLLLSAMLLSRNQKRDHEQEMLRGAATLYMVVTGIVYASLLAGADVQTPIPWINIVLHYVFPIVMLADWLYDKPGKKITPRQSLLWLIFPVVYVIYSLIRGPFAHHWYPYPFLNVSQHGYAIVIVNSTIIGLVVVLLSLILIKLPRTIRKVIK